MRRCLWLLANLIEALFSTPLRESCTVAIEVLMQENQVPMFSICKPPIRGDDCVSDEMTAPQRAGALFKFH